MEENLRKRLEDIEVIEKRIKYSTKANLDTEVGRSTVNGEKAIMSNVARVNGTTMMVTNATMKVTNAVMMVTDGMTKVIDDARSG
jgi:hypothetical protein